MTDQGAGERVPTIEESSNALERLISIWVEQNRGGTVEIPIIEGSPIVGVTIHIMAKHSVALSESILALTSQNMILQSVPIMRLTMECAVTAAWLSVTPNASNAARHEDARDRLATITSIFEDLDMRDDELLADARFAVSQLSKHKTDTARKFETRCKSIAGGEKIYVLYRMLSRHSHAGIGLTDLYLKNSEESAENPYGVSLLEKTNYPLADADLAQQVGMLALALTAWDNIQPTHPSRSALDAIAQDFGFGLGISLASTNS